MACYILQEKQNGRQQIVIIYIEEDEVIVGREHFSSLRCFNRVSRRHAKFQKSVAGELFVSDLKSRNGLYVNFRKVGSALCLLKAGDQIGFGSPDVRADNKAFICTLLKKAKEKKVNSHLNSICTAFSSVSSDREIDAVTNMCYETEKDLPDDSFLNTVDHSMDSISLPDASVPQKSLNTSTSTYVTNKSSKFPAKSRNTKSIHIKSEKRKKLKSKDNVKKTSKRALSVLKEFKIETEREGPKNEKKMTLNSSSGTEKKLISSKQCENSCFERSGLFSDSSTDEGVETQEASSFRKMCVKNKKVICDEAEDGKKSCTNKFMFNKFAKIANQKTEPFFESPKNLNRSFENISDVKDNHEPANCSIIQRTVSSIETTCFADCVNFPADYEHSEASIESESKIIIPLTRTFFGKTDLASTDKCHNWNSKKAYVSEWISKHQCTGNECSENQKLDIMIRNPEAKNVLNSMNSLQECNETNNECFPNERAKNTAEIGLEQDDGSNSDISSLKSDDRVIYPSQSKKIAAEAPEVNARETDKNAGTSIVIQGQTFNLSDQNNYINRVKDPKNSKISIGIESEVKKTVNETKEFSSKRKNAQRKRKMHNSCEEESLGVTKATKRTQLEFKEKGTEYSKVKSSSPVKSKALDDLNFLPSKSPLDAKKDSIFEQQLILQSSSDLLTTENSASIKDPKNCKISNGIESIKKTVVNETKGFSSKRKKAQRKRKMSNICEEDNLRVKKATKTTELEPKEKDFEYSQVKSSSFIKSKALGDLNFLPSIYPLNAEKDSGFQQQLILKCSSDLLTTENSVSINDSKNSELSNGNESEIKTVVSEIKGFSSKRKMYISSEEKNLRVTKATKTTELEFKEKDIEYPRVKSSSHVKSKALDNLNFLPSKSTLDAEKDSRFQQQLILESSSDLLSIENSVAEIFQKKQTETVAATRHVERNMNAKKCGIFSGLADIPLSEKRNSEKSLSNNRLNLSPEIEAQGFCSRSSGAQTRISLRDAQFLGNNLDKLSPCEKLISKEDEMKYKENNKRSIINDMIRKIVHWNCKWLMSQRRNPCIPECTSALPLQFKSFDLYMDSFSSVLTLEIWEVLYQASKLIMESNFQNNKFKFCVLNSSKQNGVVIFTCELFVNDVVAHCPQNGSIIFFRNPRAYPISYALGYIFKRERAENNSSVCTSEWRNRSSITLDKSELWIIKVCARRNLKALPEKTLIEANIVCNLYDKVVLVDRILDLRSSIFLKDILAPTYNAFCTEPVPTEITARERGDCSLCQRLIIERIVFDITKFPRVPRISLLEGLPGTGKTHVIIRILENLIFGRKLDKEILVIVPSSSALDEINRRIIELNELNAWRDTKLKFERLGSPDEMDPTLRTVSEKTELYSNGIKKNCEEIDSGNKLSCTDEENVFNGPSKFLANLKENVLKNTKNYNHCDPCTDEIFGNTNIVLCTLSSFSKYISVPRRKCIFEKRFSLCIVDDSTQCTEPEILSPFTLNITKLILVGDHKELAPSLFSKCALKCGLGRSLFERFKDNFTQSLYEYPIHTLTEQFRMHPQICNFPSRHFYDGRLVTAPDIEMKYEIFSVCPYTVVDVLNNSASETDEKIALLIASFCSEAVQATSSTSVGIITPDDHKKKLCLKLLPENLRKIVKVNTLDKFQGQEKDVMIISCFSGCSSKKSFINDRKKLNVALTRARLCLIIIGLVDSLISHPDWKELIKNANSRKRLVRVSFNEDIKSVFHKYMLKK